MIPTIISIIMNIVTTITTITTIGTILFDDVRSEEENNYTNICILQENVYNINLMEISCKYTKMDFKISYH